MNLYLVYILLVTVGSTFIRVSPSAVIDDGGEGQSYQKELVEAEESQIQSRELETHEDVLTEKAQLPIVMQNHGQSSSSSNLQNRRSDSSDDNQVLVKMTERGGDPPGGSTSGTIYVRWGHQNCPSSSQLVYTGSVAGAHYADNGGGANQLCLPENPVYDSPVAGIGASRSFVYGVEYQINSFPQLNAKVWHDVPCAVCLAVTRFAKLVIPGTNVCPSADWTREYGGFLMAERSHTAHNRAMHICVDREVQTIPRTVVAASMRGILNLVESRCSSTGGGISCGPYIDGYELTCAVCTK